MLGLRAAARPHRETAAERERDLTNRLDGPIQKHRPDLVLHGHAHEGTFAGTIGTVPVYNVAVHVMHRDFFVFELDSDAPEGHGARLEATA